MQTGDVQSACSSMNACARMLADAVVDGDASPEWVERIAVAYVAARADYRETLTARAEARGAASPVPAADAS